MNLFETLADITNPNLRSDCCNARVKLENTCACCGERCEPVDYTNDNPFSAKNQIWVKAENPENCKAKHHNYGVRKYGFCANCNGNDLKP